METDTYIFLGDSYIEIEGAEKEVAKFTDDALNAKKKMVFSAKSLLQTPVKLTKKNLKKYLNKTNYTISTLWNII